MSELTDISPEAAVDYVPFEATVDPSAAAPGASAELLPGAAGAYHIVLGFKKS